jgi:hypothetical protein
MTLFEKQENSLLCRFKGERILIIPWGKNSIRVLSSLMVKPVLNNWALLDPPRDMLAPEINITETEASIGVGKIKAVIRGWGVSGGPELSFYNKCRSPAGNNAGISEKSFTCRFNKGIFWLRTTKRAVKCSSGHTQLTGPVT